MLSFWAIGPYERPSHVATDILSIAVLLNRISKSKCSPVWSRVVARSFTADGIFDSCRFAASKLTCSPVHRSRLHSKWWTVELSPCFDYGPRLLEFVPGRGKRGNYFGSGFYTFLFISSLSRHIPQFLHRLVERLSSK